MLTKHIGGALGHMKMKHTYSDKITLITKTLGLRVSVEVVLKSHDSK